MRVERGEEGEHLAEAAAEWQRKLFFSFSSAAAHD
jgi:hypothetical protein